MKAMCDIYGTVKRFPFKYLPQNKIHSSYVKKRNAKTVRAFDKQMGRGP